MNRVLVFMAVAAISLQSLCPAESEVEDFEGAEPLLAESLGEPVKTMRLYQQQTAPHRDGNGYDLLLFYYDFNVDIPCQAVVIDLVTGQLRQSRPAQGGAPWRFAMGRDGNLYMGHYGSAAVWIYDPDKKQIRFVESDIRDVGTVSSIACGADGKIYCGTTPKVKSFQYDPITGEFTDYGIQGPVRKYLGYGYTIGADDDFVYTASGKIPWHIVAFNKKTGEQQWLVKGDPADYVSVDQQRHGCVGRHLVRSGDKKGQRFEYWLYKGKAIPKKPRDDPPWPTAEPEEKSAAAKPQLFLERAAPGSDGWAEVWWLPPGAEPANHSVQPADEEQQGWRKARFQVEVSPAEIRRIEKMPDGRLIGSSSNYQDFFVYDPTGGEFATLGKIPLSHYATCFAGQKVYLAGYPSTAVYEYEPAKPWTPGRGTPHKPAPPVESPQSNPRRLCYLAEKIFTHHGRTAVAGADGRVYVGAHAERSHVGGGLGWWDPATGTYGGIREPFELYDVAGLAAVDGGKKIVYSSRTVRDPQTQQSPQQARLFVYDTQSAKITLDFAPLPGRNSAGPIACVGANTVIGAAAGASRDGCTLYIADVAAGRVTRQRDLPSPQRGAFRLGPDGRLWTFLDDVLVRVDPQTLDVAVIGRLPDAGDFALAGNDIYFAGQASLRGARGVVAR